MPALSKRVGAFTDSVIRRMTRKKYFEGSSWQARAAKRIIEIKSSFLLTL